MRLNTDNTETQEYIARNFVGLKKGDVGDKIQISLPTFEAVEYDIMDWRISADFYFENNYVGSTFANLCF